MSKNSNPKEQVLAVSGQPESLKMQDTEEEHLSRYVKSQKALVTKVA